MIKAIQLRNLLRHSEARSKTDAMTVTVQITSSEAASFMDNLRALLTSCATLATKADVQAILNQIMKTQAELVADLKLVRLQQEKTTQEITALQAGSTALQEKVTDLQTQLDAAIAAGAVTQELQDAVAAVAVQAQTNDDLIPDLPPTPEAPPA